MPKKSTLAVKDRRKFHKQIAALGEHLGGVAPVDLSFLEGIPKFIGKDEPLPCPSGSGKGRKFGQWRRKKTDHVRRRTIAGN